jgi:hypothetical protein
MVSQVTTVTNDPFTCLYSTIPQAEIDIARSLLTSLYVVDLIHGLRAMISGSASAEHLLQALSLEAGFTHCQGSLPKLPSSPARFSYFGFLNTSMLAIAASCQA